MRDIVIVIVGVVLIGLTWLGWQQYEAMKGAPQGGVACTMEAKLCPDGSAVGRTGPHCEFAPCPPSTSSGQAGIKGTVMLGPTCPVERIPPDPQCADKPFATKLVVTSADGAHVIATFESGADGAFIDPAKPGRVRDTLCHTKHLAALRFRGFV